jgi:hypothetical protein
VGDGNRRCETGERAAKRTRRVALNHEDRRPIGEQRGDRAGDFAGMDVGIAAARVGQRDALILGKPMVRCLQRMLGREDQPWLKVSARQCGDDRS